MDQPGRLFAYVFEAKSIQRYILDTGRLRDVIAASSLIDALCTPVAGNLLDALLSALAPLEHRISRRTAGALSIVFANADDRRLFQAAWTLAVQRAAPGLDFSQGVGEGASHREAIDKAVADGIARGVQHSIPIPVAGPLAARAPRTGNGAVSRGGRAGELSDAASEAKRPWRASDRLGEKLGFRLPDGRLAVWPVELDAAGAERGDDDDGRAFPFNGDNRYIAIIHADGNGLGALVRSIADQAQAEAHGHLFPEALQAFSLGLERATVNAARRACGRLPPAPDSTTMPARPFVLGGDDLGFIVRGDVALDFAEEYLAAFEQETAALIRQLGEDASIFLPPGARREGERVRVVVPGVHRLTACAGVAFVKSSQPFYMAFELAESLCRFAKMASSGREGAPSALAFHRVTTSMIDDYAAIRDAEMLIVTDRGAAALSAQPFFAGEAMQHPRLADFRRLHDSLAGHELPSSGLREALGLVRDGPEAARSRYARWRQVVKRRTPQALGEVDKSLEELAGGGADAEDFFHTFHGEVGCIWGDVLSWKAVLGER